MEIYLQISDKVENIGTDNDEIMFGIQMRLKQKKNEEELHANRRYDTISLFFCGEETA